MKNYIAGYIPEANNAFSIMCYFHRLFRLCVQHSTISVVYTTTLRS